MNDRNHMYDTHDDFGDDEVERQRWLAQQAAEEENQMRIKECEALRGTLFFKHIGDAYDKFADQNFTIDSSRNDLEHRIEAVLVAAVQDWNAEYGTRFDPYIISKWFIINLPIDLETRYNVK